DYPGGAKAEYAGTDSDPVGDAIGASSAVYCSGHSQQFATQGRTGKIEVCKVEQVEDSDARLYSPSLPELEPPTDFHVKRPQVSHRYLAGKAAAPSLRRVLT